MKLRFPTAGGALFAALLTLVLFSRPAFAQDRTLVASLDGGASGDQDGSGLIWVDLNQGKGEICYELAIQGTGPVSNLRIYELASGHSVALLLNGVGTTSDCVRVDKEIVKEIRRNPDEFGIVVGTSQYPVSALAGALTPPTEKDDKEKEDKAKEEKDKEADNAPSPALPALINAGEVDWANVPWADFDWTQIDWEGIDWENIDWATVDLQSLGFPEGFDVSELKLPPGLDLSDLPFLLNPDWSGRDNPGQNGNDGWNDAPGDGNNGRGNDDDEDDD